MELGLSPAQVDEIEPEMLWHMRQHAQRVRIENAVLLSAAFHDPKRLQSMLKEAEPQEVRQMKQAADLFTFVKQIAKPNGNS